MQPERAALAGMRFLRLITVFLHANGSVSTMQFCGRDHMRCKCYCRPRLAPKRRGGGLAVGASEGTNCALVVVLLLFSDGSSLLCTAANRRNLVSTPWLAFADLESVGKIVVVGGAAAAACSAASPIAKAIAGARPRLGVVLSRAAGSSWNHLCFLGRRACVTPRTAGSGAMGAVRLHVETAGVADCATVWCPSPKRCDVTPQLEHLIPA